MLWVKIQRYCVNYVRYYVKYNKLLKFKNSGPTWLVTCFYFHFQKWSRQNLILNGGPKLTEKRENRKTYVTKLQCETVFKVKIITLIVYNIIMAYYVYDMFKHKMLRWNKYLWQCMLTSRAPATTPWYRSTAAYWKPSSDSEFDCYQRRFWTKMEQPTIF